MTRRMAQHLLRSPAPNEALKAWFSAEWMLQAGEETNLSDEADLARLRGRIGVQNLDSDGPLMAAVARKVHGRECALPYLLLDLVTALEGNAQRRDRICGKNLVGQSESSRHAGAGDVLVLTA